MCTCTLAYFHTPPDWCCTRILSLHAFAHPQELLPRGVGASSRMCFSRGGVLLLKPVVSTLALPAQAFPRARLPQCPNLVPAPSALESPACVDAQSSAQGKLDLSAPEFQYWSALERVVKIWGWRGSYLEVISVEQTLF